MIAGPRARTLRLLGGLLALYLAVPLGAFLVRLARSPNPGFGLPGLFPAALVSVETASISAAVIALFGLPLAYLLARSRHRRTATAVGLVAQLPLALPPLMSGILLIYLVGPYSALGRAFGGHLTDTLTGIVLAQCFVAAPFLVSVARAAFSEIDPALFDLAATLGHREYGRFFRVALPAARGGIAAGLLLAWLHAFGEYGATLILAYHPYSLPVFTDLQFAGAGLTDTEAPTAVALFVAAAVVLVAHFATVRRGHGRGGAPAVAPKAAAPARPLAVSFSLHARLGDFSLSLAHRGSAPTLAILGPSGSGKSVTLRAIAGLLGPGAGEVAFDGQPVAGVPVEARRVGYVPQSGALFPGRTVWRQVTFSSSVDDGLAAYWLERLGIAALANRLPDRLSGGERQRVHLARALACSPRLLLLDEPFSALDAPVREALRDEFRRLQREEGLSSVLVTHDPVEAAMLAEELLVVAEGRLLQGGRREDVFSRPASPTVARLVGIENVLSGILAAGVLRCGSLHIALPATSRGASTDGSSVQWCLPTARARLVASGEHQVLVLDVIDRGLRRVARCETGGGVLLAEVGGGGAPTVGERAGLDIDADALTCWPAAEE